MMKLALALLLCGLSASFATPTCNESDVYRLTDVEKYPKTEERLKEVCRKVLPEFDNQIRFVDRCPNTLLAAFQVSLRLTRELYGKICEEGNPLRATYLSRAACLEENVESSEFRCSEEVTEQDYCKRIDPVQKCAREALNRLCGTDGGPLYAELDKIRRAQKEVFCRTE